VALAIATIIGATPGFDKAMVGLHYFGEIAYMAITFTQALISLGWAWWASPTQRVTVQKERVAHVVHAMTDTMTRIIGLHQL
jgi:hypothetical protein